MQRRENRISLQSAKKFDPFEVIIYGFGCQSKRERLQSSHGAIPIPVASRSYTSSPSSHFFSRSTSSLGPTAYFQSAIIWTRSTPNMGIPVMLSSRFNGTRCFWRRGLPPSSLHPGVSAPHTRTLPGAWRYGYINLYPPNNAIGTVVLAADIRNINTVIIGGQIRKFRGKLVGGKTSAFGRSVA